VIAGNDTRIENIEFSGARVPDQNGAGIRQEGANLNLVHCYFHDNQEGILAGEDPASRIVIDSSVFARNGAGDGYSHNIYINRLPSLRDQWHVRQRPGPRRRHRRGPGSEAPVLAEDDISTESPVFVSQAQARIRHDCLTPDPGFLDPGRYDYRLAATSACRPVGVRPGRAQGFPLVPRFQYVHVAGHVLRTDGGTIAGAFGGVR
jgi:hypothetical protein